MLFNVFIGDFDSDVRRAAREQLGSIRLSALEEFMVRKIEDSIRIDGEDFGVFSSLGLLSSLPTTSRIAKLLYSSDVADIDPRHLRADWDEIPNLRVVAHTALAKNSVQQALRHFDSGSFNEGLSRILRAYLAPMSQTQTFPALRDDAKLRLWARCSAELCKFAKHGVGGYLG